RAATAGADAGGAATACAHLSARPRDRGAAAAAACHTRGMANCKLCHAARLETDDELVTTICAPCATKIGTTPMPPPRRPDVPCPRCRGTRFIRVFPRERFVIDTASKWLGAEFGSIGAMYAPMAATYEVSIVRHQVGVMIGAPEVRGLDLTRPRGLI